MWLSSKVPAGAVTNAQKRTAILSASTEASIDTNSDWQTSLPLDWTKMSQRKRKWGEDDDDSSTPDPFCRDPSTCRRRHDRPRRDPPAQDRNKSSSSSFSHASGENAAARTDGIGISNRREGQAIFCLHDMNPAWVQGYFVPRGSNKPWGMLAVQEELDECLACDDGGYRRVSLTVYPSTATNFKKEGLHQRKSYKVEGVDWTGGDMMSLYHPQHVDMEGQRVLTGTKTLPIIEKYFQGLVRRLQEICNVEDDVPLLDWLPNVAIVTGSMSFTLPSSES